MCVCERERQRQRQRDRQKAQAVVQSVALKEGQLTRGWGNVGGCGTGRDGIMGR